jgi:hypothetical protein
VQKGILHILYFHTNLLKRRRRAEHTAKMQVTDIMRRRLEDAKQVRIPLILQVAQEYKRHPPPPRVAEQRQGGNISTDAGSSRA